MHSNRKQQIVYAGVGLLALGVCMVWRLERRPSQAHATPPPNANLAASVRELPGVPTPMAAAPTVTKDVKEPQSLPGVDTSEIVDPSPGPGRAEPADPRPDPGRPLAITAPKKLAPDRHADYLARMREVGGLGCDLPASQVRALLSQLDVHYDPQGGLSLTEFSAIRNDTLDALLRQRQLPEGLGLKIVRMYRDASEDLVWRDYCVQHFAIYYEERWAAGPAPAQDAEAQAIQSAYRDALRERGNMPGTALIGLARLSRRYPEFDREAIGGQALGFVRDEGRPAEVRTTAMQICVELGVSAALPSARRLAESGSSVPLRLSALAAIGEFHGHQAAGRAGLGGRWVWPARCDGGIAAT
jgi:hypothetical protein